MSFSSKKQNKTKNKMKIDLSFILPFWFPIESLTNINYNKINQANLFDKKYLLIQNKNKGKEYRCFPSTCPHQGADLSYGSFDRNRNIICPYHAFTFDSKGHFIGIHPHAERNEDKNQGCKYLKPLPTKVVDGMLYINPSSMKVIQDEVFLPPESSDPSYRAISGVRTLNTNYLSLCENLLDMLHISFVHSFGSKMSLPRKMKYESLTDYHGRTTFEYSPNNNSISTMLNSKNNMNRSNVVIVQNEFCLPTSTVTRVFFGENNAMVKTVSTKIVPLSDHKSILHWKLYRNYWVGNPVVDFLGDWIMRLLMEKTIDEDRDILRKVDANSRNGTLTIPYDRTIHEFRRTMERYRKDTLHL
jgi:phenylpropionate dioxygenase-like ring-hydroxylating dioxygenase large terminal subunit